MRLKIGQVIYPSEAGHYGFIYPNKDRPLTLTSPVEVDPLWLMGDSEYAAYQPLTELKARDSNEHYNIQNPIWVKKTTNK